MGLGLVNEQFVQNLEAGFLNDIGVVEDNVNLMERNEQ